ncbi:MAG: alpha/beta hydrolase [Bacteroidota bacterium]|nr:alpha/beta hydrolase [Bacteroidota bacterium]
MIKNTNFKGDKLYYTIKGEGKVIMLLHGFLESSETWGAFAEELSKSFKVIIPDLPGHGKSGLSLNKLQMKYMAASVEAILEREAIKKAFVVGHSMGGYVACAFAQQFNERLSGLCLLHSHPFGDSQEKKADRNAAVKLLEADENSKIEICRNHAPKVFAGDNVLKFKTEIEQGLQIALNTDIKTIQATLRGMRDRSDRSQIIENLAIPFLYVQGVGDNFIPLDTMTKELMPPKGQIMTLKNAGHMGFIEEPEPLLDYFIEHYK